jgi:arylsulfatase A-like enzyme
MPDMTRRTALGLGLAGSAACAAVAQEITARVEGEVRKELRFIDPKRGRNRYQFSPPRSRPHIFVLTADMVSPDHYHPSRTLQQHMELPTLRTLAADGVTFNSAFCASPLCAPARAALFTGRYTYITANGERAHDGHETVLRPDDVIFQEYLKATGYITKHAGKGHVGVPKFIDAFDENSAGWDRWNPPIRSDEFYQDHLRRLGVRGQEYAREIRGLEPDRKTPGNSTGGWLTQPGGRPFPMEATYSYFLAQQAVTKLDAALAQKTGPVYLQLDLFDPHQPFGIPAGLERRERELRAICRELPGSYGEAVSNDWKSQPGQPKIYDLYRRYWGLYDRRTVEDYRVANALQMEVVDGALGVFIGELKRRGLYDDSIIVFTADHGEMNGRRAVIDKGVYLYPDVLRVPLTIKMPAGGAVRPHAVESPVTHLDVAPTLLALAGIQPEARMDGLSLLPLLAGEPGGDRDFVFECGTHVGVNFACGMQSWLGDGRHYLYSYNVSSNIDELYDLQDSDAPNLTGNTEHAAIRSRMIGRLGAVLARDPRWLAYWSSFRLDKYFDLPRQSGDMQLPQK